MKLAYYLIPLFVLALILAVGAAYLSGTLYKSPTKMQQSEQSSSLSICGWLPWWQYDEAMAEVISNEGLYTHVSPFIYSLQDDYSIKEHIPPSTDRITSSDVSIIPTISNDFDSDVVSEILNDEDLLNQHIDDIVSLTNDNQYDGIEIDYEEVYATDKDAFSNFISQLSLRLHSDMKLLSVTLHPKTSEKGTWDGNQSQDWPELAKHADYLRIMAYDYHWSTSQPGPLSPKSWLEDVTTYALETIPQEKRILGIGLYGYDWEVGTTIGNNKTLDQINTIISTHNASPHYDETYESPYVTYTEQGTDHIVWFEDARSLEHKLTVAKDNYAGICIWSLGEIPEGHYTLLRTYK